MLVSSINSSYGDFVDKINAKIDSEAKTKRDLEPMFHYAYSVRRNDIEIGGIFGFDNFGACHIEGLWVEPDYRKQGVGKMLVEKAEKFAYDRKCKCIALFTMDFQAYEFYYHLGYRQEFIRDYYHNNSKAIYMIKPIQY
jgi:ribosomal protein S18 acetylase RimI-like enzyme